MMRCELRLESGVKQWGISVEGDTSIFVAAQIIHGLACFEPPPGEAGPWRLSLRIESENVRIFQTWRGSDLRETSESVKNALLAWVKSCT